jgi:hypothetical protein
MARPQRPPHVDERTAHEIELARYQERRTRILLWVFIGMMPGGCLCPVSMLWMVNNQTLGIALMIAMILLPLVGLGGMLLMLSDRSRYRRALAIAEQAGNMGFGYAYRPRKKELELVRAFALFQSADVDDAYNCIAGEIAGYQLTVMEYNFQIGYGKYAAAYKQVVAVVHGAGAGLPRFTMQPFGWLEKLVALVGSSAIPIPQRPEFGKRFQLHCRKPDAILPLFTPQVVEMCMQDKRQMLSANGEEFLYGLRNTGGKPDQLPDLAATAVRFVAAMPPTADGQA